MSVVFLRQPAGAITLPEFMSRHFPFPIGRDCGGLAAETSLHPREQSPAAAADRQMTAQK